MGTDEFSPGRMDRHFDRVETELNVGPNDRKIIGPIADVMSKGCDALGWKHGPIRRNAPGCDGSGFCDFGCRTDARQGTNLSYVPWALEKGALLLTGLRADRVLLEGKRAVGLECTTKGGKPLRVRAHGAVVLSGGAVPTPMFLLGQDLGNGSGQVGRNLTLHPSASLSAVFDEKIRGYAHAPQGYCSEHFLRDGILMVAAQPDLNVAASIYGFSGRRLMDTLDRIDQIASFGLLLTDASANGRVWRNVRGYPVISYNLQPLDMARAHASMVHCGEMCLAAGAKQLIPGVVGAPFLDGGRDFARFRRRTLAPADVLWTSYHPLGTCKMGRDPRTSVVGLDHQLHDVPGLYAVDGSTVPGPLGVNPQITIMSMAHRAAERIADNLGAPSLSQAVGVS
jgi:choline dehydrogenase-like flavoprotein